MPSQPTRRAGRVARLVQSPEAWVLAGALVLFGVGLGWGLPASDTWDNDGVAPRDFLVALSQTFDKGGFDFAYLHLAPVHLVLLAILTAPVTLPALLSAPSRAPDAIVAHMIQTPTMTAIAWVARGTSVAMALATVWALGRTAREVAGKRAGVLVSAVSALDVALVYYAHATNLEVPYLFWGALALLFLVRAVVREEPGACAASPSSPRSRSGRKTRRRACFSSAHRRSWACGCARATRRGGERSSAKRSSRSASPSPSSSSQTRSS